MKIYLITLALVFFSLQVQAQKSNASFTLLAVGQGVSVPTITSAINEAHGYTYNNTAVARYYNGAQLSLEYDKNEHDAAYGAEFGVGNGQVGLGVGYKKPDCDNCDGRFGSIAGFGLGNDFSLGLGYHEKKNYSVGSLIKLGSAVQLGITIDYQDNGDSKLNTYSYGLGLAYVSDNVKFALDASKRTDGDSSTDDGPTMLTPGIMLDAGWVRLAVSYDTYLEDKNNTYDDKTWFGVGFGQYDKWSFNIYKDYTADYSGVLTFWF